MPVCGDISDVPDKSFVPVKYLHCAQKSAPFTVPVKCRLWVYITIGIPNLLEIG